MLGSMVLEVAIGIVFVYLLLSLIVTAITELVAGFLKWRSDDLWKGIRTMVDDGTAETWVTKLYDHPLINGMTLPSKLRMAPKGKGPSYIPSRTFAVSLLDAVKGSAGGAPIGESIQKLPDGKLKQTLTVLLDEAHGDADKLKSQVEVWFNNSMERVSGWYKRRTQAFHLALSLLVTFVINVDTVLVVNALSQNQALRDTVVAEAEAYAKTDPTKDTNEKPVDTIKQLQGELALLDLPVGWVLPGQRAYSHDNSDYRVWPGWRYSGTANEWLVYWFQTVRFHFLGWLLTAFAISLGAPFWFDILNKIINIRAAGKAPEEKPKNPQQVPQPREPGQAPAVS
jgi:hypothetical protein